MDQPTTQFEDQKAAPPAAWAWTLPTLEGLAVTLYFGRDAFAGVVRYYASLTHLDPLWFVPDVFAFACIGAFVYRYAFKRTNVLAILFLLYVVFALFLGYVFLGEAKGLASSIKMIAPAFVGFCFCGREFKDQKFLLGFIYFLLFASIMGLMWSAHSRLPWVAFSYESFGATRTAARLWWTGGESRVSGFAADSTMAAYFVLITYVFTSVRKSVLWCLLWAGPAFYAIHLSTNKTAIGVLAIYVAALLFVRAFNERHRFSALRAIALWSFTCILLPLVLMATLSGTNMARIAKGLYSLQDRINNSWQLPFVYMNDLMPLGYFTGCGLGCFNYPQQLFSNKVAYYVPVDNFYIGTYLMFGPIFVLFMVFVILAVARTRDIYKLTVIFVMNFYTITVLGYGPASGLLVITMGFSEVFGPKLNPRTFSAEPNAIGRQPVLRVASG
ncbi:hypothetical protein XH89_30465 [Bradyrhizobium sp. CCBAU 53340]|uniref:hypothetical protein n=1 Tax=Bradyrhizobium sp. CCBAU 53340 TaxID=1325112 RepID=UPI00188BE6AB|nr:hypothetical protein [Bradyrhizobium sp. CCBAU 53340]QOZ47328.1 hypothetical protein XH89_30465 [Bradyrhizobium sp. CCBAU 53340]